MSSTRDMIILYTMLSTRDMITLFRVLSTCDDHNINITSTVELSK